MQQIIIPTPLGDMVAVFSQRGLCLLEFADQTQLPRELAAVEKARKAEDCTNPQHVQLLQTELAAYFSGSLKNFSVPLDPIGTPFQQQVWQILCQIPYGETLSYKQQSEKLGNPKAIRAVASANGQNKISILIPCHRVIGSSGHLTGYAGGLSRKQFLLNLERQTPALF
ncbi:Methylated-DNA--protein-cysteine methyltransferase [Kingella negevensis]|uniref:Methylated-DNA--protein-cysteine methyltransferase n=1 Tax=Kingella negevensis TaxID=1522312 RepID=A0A238TC00_9NEIS|nr:Methylated-DNA--protein-cysteine methyltransferase [Kingella negevensis]